MFAGESALHWNGEAAGCAEFVDEIFHAAELVAILVAQADGGLNSLLPAAVQKQPLLRRETQRPLIPHAIFQHAQFFEQFANVRCLGSGHWDIVRGPRIGSDLVFAPAGISSRLIVHLEQDEVLEAALIQTPRCAQPGNASAYDDDRMLFNFLCPREGGAIAQQMAKLERVVHETAGNRTIAFYRKSHQRRTRRLQELSARNLQWLMSFQS